MFNEGYYNESIKERSYLISKFQNNLKHNGYGSRYKVTLPFFYENRTLPDTCLLAKTRTGNLLKQLAKGDTLLNNYDTIFKEYLQEERGNDRETSKMHIVFDAPVKFKNEKSRNDILDLGPYLLPLLFNILLRFRTRKLGLITDIKQAFVHIEVALEHRDFFRFMWFDRN